MTSNHTIIIQYEDNDYVVGPDWVSQILQHITAIQRISAKPGYEHTVKTELRLIREHIEDSLLNYNSLIDCEK